MSSGARLHALLQAILQLEVAIRPLPGAWSLFHHLVLSRSSPTTSRTAATLKRWSHTNLHSARYSSVSSAHAIRQPPALLDNQRLVDAPVDAAQLASLLALLRTGQHTTLLAETHATPPISAPMSPRTTASPPRLQQDDDRLGTRTC